MFDLYTQHIVRIVGPLLLTLCTFTAIATFLLQDFFQVAYVLKNMGVFHSLLGVVLGLFLVLRTNTAYDRWWEGRKIWGELINSVRVLAIKVYVFLPSLEDRSFFSVVIPNFVYAMKEHLREGVKLNELTFATDQQRQFLQKAAHKPNLITRSIYERLNKRLKEEKLTGEQFFLLDKEAKAMLHHLGACERIKSTPIPYSYQMYIKKFIFIYSLTLPFAFIPHMGYWSVLMVGIIFYVLVSIELIAEEIEDPFGLDINDLPVEKLCMMIKENVHEILIPEEDQKQPKSSLEEAQK